MRACTYQGCIRYVSGRIRVCTRRPEGRSSDTCIRSAESLYQVVSGAYQDCISSLEGHLPRPGISEVQPCIRHVSGVYLSLIHIIR